jgi:hypothetical protein
VDGPVQWLVGFLPKEKRPGRKIDLSFSSGAEVKNEWSYTSDPIRLQGVDGDKRYLITFTSSTY